MTEKGYVQKAVPVDILQIWFPLSNQSKRKKEMIDFYPAFVRYSLNILITAAVHCFAAKNKGIF